LYVIDGLLSFIIAIFASTALATDTTKLTCPTTLSQSLGPKVVRQLRSVIDEVQHDFRPKFEAAPEELAYTVNQNLLLFRRYALLNPVRSSPEIIADTYYGSDYSTSSPDLHVMPVDPRVLCLLEPSHIVFLSDGVTHHYATVYGVDYRHKVITLADPWASVSFLLAGRNVLGVKARPYRNSHGQPVLDLSFSEFLGVLRGSVEASFPMLMFETMEKLYPELAQTEDYLFWKYTRMFASDNLVTSFMTLKEISSRTDIAKMPRLRLLFEWGSDYTFGMLSNFQIHVLGQGATASAPPRQREAFLKRLGDYARTLPWTLKWLLLHRTDETKDMQLRLSIIDSFLKADPTDNDFQIARAETLLRQRQAGESLAQLDAANVQWTADVAAAIAKTLPTQAVEFLFKKDYDSQPLAILHWRYQRIQLLRLIASLQQNRISKIEVQRTMLDLHRKYVIGSLLKDFFPQLLEIAFLEHELRIEELYIKTVIGLPLDDELSAHFARGMFEHFTTRRSIQEMSQPTLIALRRSPMHRELCAIIKEDPILTPEILKLIKEDHIAKNELSKPLWDDLNSFCSMSGPTRKKERRGQEG
jgi:hypothetical protein